MKVNFESKCENVNYTKPQCACTSLKPACADKAPKIDVQASDCSESYGRATVALHGTRKPQSKEDLTEILNKIIAGTGMRIGRHINDKHIQIGRPVEGFKELCYDDMRARCIRDENNFISAIYTLDNATGEVKIYDADANLKKHFTKNEMKALKEYKYSVDELHQSLRHGIVRGLCSREEIGNIVATLDSLFNNEQKVMRTTKDITLYRALQPDLSEAEKDTLTTIGGIYTDKSFVSTTTDFNVAKRFQSLDNPILKIEVPKGTKYFDMDALFNIDRQHWQEKEYLLNRGSRFEVTGFDVLNNIINVKYLG